MTRILVIDPGMTSGVVYAQYDALTPVTILGKWEVKGGLTGFLNFIDTQDLGFSTHEYYYGDRVDEVVSEKFSPLPRVFRLDELEPLRIEGALQAEYGSEVIHWQKPGAMSIGGVGHGSPAKNKRAADDVLRRAGLWSMPKEFPEHGDANDVNAAMKHLIARMRTIGHQPTLSAVLGV